MTTEFRLQLAQPQTLRLKITQTPSLRVKVLPGFPGTVSGAGGISVIQSGSNFQIGWDPTSAGFTAFGLVLATAANASSARGSLGFPASSTDNTIVRFDGTAGGMQTSVAVLDDTGILTTKYFQSATATGVSAGMTATCNGTVQIGFNATDASGGFAVIGSTTNHDVLYVRNSVEFFRLNANGVLALTQILSSGATNGIGYAAGAGGTITQITSKATGVTLNKVCGAITMNNAALAAATIVTFTLNDTAIAATDLILAMHESAGTLGSYTINARATGAGTAAIDVRNNTAGSLSEAIVIRFAVFKSVNS